MRTIGPHKVYIRERDTPIFPSRSVKYPTDGHVVTPSKNGFGGYLGKRGKAHPNDYITEKPYFIGGAYGNLYFRRIEVKQKPSYTFWDAGEEVFACLAFTKGRIYYGATFGEGMIVDFDGGFEEYANYQGYGNETACEDAKTHAWKMAERAAERMADQRAEEIEQDEHEQAEEREREEQEENALIEKAREIAKTLPLPPGVEVNKLSQVQLVNDNASAYVYATYPVRVDFEKD